MIRLRPFRRLRANSDGATLVEFAFVAPVLIVGIMGIFDMGFTMYARSVMQGALQQSARASTLETGPGAAAALDARVAAAIRDVAPGADVQFTRKNYSTFQDVGQPEVFTDNNGDGECNAGEPFEDANFNGSWDEDRGADGSGGARDAVLYSATATYDRLLPMAGLIGMDEQITIKAATVLRNQPYDEQGDREPVTEHCT